jgi:hypothetical protein
MAKQYLRIDGDAGERAVYIGNDGTNAADILVETGDISPMDMFTLMCTAGAFQVFVSLDGTNFTTDPLSLSDLGGTSTDPVLLGAPNRLFGFAGAYRAVRVEQINATACVNFSMFAKRQNK